MCPKLFLIYLQYKGKVVFFGADDLDLYKGIDLKIDAFEKVLQLHEDLRDQIVLIQVFIHMFSFLLSFFNYYYIKSSII